MFDMDWLPHPASWPSSSSFPPDVLVTVTENLLKLVQCRGRGSNILVSCRGRSYLWFFSSQFTHSSKLQSQPCSSPFTPPGLNHICSLSRSLSWDFMGVPGCVVGMAHRNREWVKWWLGVPYPPGVLVGLGKQWSQILRLLKLKNHVHVNFYIKESYCSNKKTPCIFTNYLYNAVQVDENGVST